MSRGGRNRIIIIIMCCKKKRNLQENHPTPPQPPQEEKKDKKFFKKNKKESLANDALKVDLDKNLLHVQNTTQLDTPPPKTQREKCVSCCKKFVAFLFSTIGLTCVLCGYTIFGGFIFMWLESENEDDVKFEVKNKRLMYVEKLWNLTYDLNLFHPQNWSNMANEIMLEYTTQIVKATKEKGWDGEDSTESGDKQWTFPGALLYSITVITTIGRWNDDISVPNKARPPIRDG